MSNPTTPFNWQMPTSTDLVTDLPADFEVFGQAVASSMADLLGGTTGQILSKASNTDMDFTWIANDQGDITAVNVTSPITGGGSAGAVTVGIQDGTTAQKGAVQLENSTSSTSTTTAAVPASVKSAYDLADGAIAKTTVTTAGDIIYRNATIPTRLGIGTAGQVLTVNTGATAPEWKTPASASTFVGCAVYTTTNQSIANSTYTAINFNSESIDTDGFHSTTTNTSRITIPSGKAGKYLITFHVMYDPSVTGSRSINVNKNGSLLMGSGEVPGSAGSYVYNSGSFIADLAVADYLEFMIYQTSGGALTVYCRDREKPFQVEYLGA